MARDPGLQVERTLLAWRRTTLALTIATLVVARLTVSSVGASALVPALLVGAGLLWEAVILVRRRGVSHAQEPYFDSMLPDGRLPLAVALIAAGLCVGEIAGVLSQIAG